MKFSKYFMLAGVAAMLTACSTEEPLVQEPQGYPVPAEVAENDTYALISLGLASDGQTRAASFAEEGDPTEYRILNGYLLLFDTTGTNGEEGKAKYVDNVSLNYNWQDETTYDDISKKSYAAVAFKKGTFETGHTYGGIIVLNAPDNYPMPTKDQEFSDWNQPSEVTFTLTDGSNTYMTMVSAPKYESTKDNVSKTTVLTNLPISAVVHDMAKLSAATVAANFYVHRVAAKVTFKTKNNGVYTITGGTGATVTLTEWAMDGVAKAAYPIQNVEGLDLSADHMHTTVAGKIGFARCTWGKGAYYDKTADEHNAGLNWLGTLAKDTKFTSTYIKENTMPATAQMQNRTTRVLIKAQYKLTGKSGDLVRAGLITNMIETVADYEAELKNQVALLWGGVTEDKITVTVKDAAKKAGVYSLKDRYTFKKDGVEDPLSDKTILDHIAQAMYLTNADAKEISIFTNGECYYKVLVKHFDDTETKWTEEFKTGFFGTDETKKGTYTDDQTGRYGVVRNNWYEITVNSINRIGTPTPPTPPTTPDDEELTEVDAIDFNVHMLNWAKRTQSADL